MMLRCLDRKEVRHATWRVHCIRDHPASGNTGCLFLAGRSTPTGLAIVHWIGCINAIKIIFLMFYVILENPLNQRNERLIFCASQNRPYL